MRLFNRPTLIVLALATMTSFLAGCRKQQDQQSQPQGNYQQQGYPQQQQGYPQQGYPQQQGYPTQGTQPTQQTQAPAGNGLPCQTDNDPQCPFARCLGGKCGPCSTAEHCKAGAACVQTLVGMACVPAGMPGAAPQQ